MATTEGGAGPPRPVPGPATLDQIVRLLTALPGRGASALAVLNGLVGDALAERGSPLAIPLSFRTASGDEVPFDRDGIERTIPGAGPRLCVLVHGLMSSETVWRIGGPPQPTYGDLLAGDRGLTPLYVRYNTGRHVSTNGRELAAKLQRLVRSWPVRVREIDLVGHSMGGLVVRSACHYGAGSATLADRSRRRGPWTRKVERVVLLGVPNRGASLEVIANLASAALWSLPVPATRLVGAGLDRRSDGIKDLRWGSVLDEDWHERDPGATERPEPSRVRSPRRARYLVVAGSPVERSEPDAPVLVDRLLGDALVTASSARGLLGDEGSRLFPNVTVRVCPRVNHVALANHRDVYNEIAAWWDPNRAILRRFEPFSM